MSISVKPLGAGQEVGRSCVIVKVKDVKIMFDCGVHMAFHDNRKFPDFKKILDDEILPPKVQKNLNSNSQSNQFQFNQSGGKEQYQNPNISTINLNDQNIQSNNIYSNLDDKIDYTNYVDLVIITHFHLDHCGALPYFTEICGYNGPILTSQPTKAILPITLEDFRKIISDFRGEKSILHPDQIFKCLNKVQTMEIGEEKVINNRIKVTSYYAGHVLGAGIYKVEVDGYTVVYTGDYNTSSDRHLGGAYIPKIYPDILITETTYGDTIRDTKRVREREFLKKIQSTIDKGGKVLIPIFALGRAQELCILLDTHWRRTKSEVPIYFAGPLAEKANFYYKLFTNWTNSKIKNMFLDRNVFDFTFVKHGDKSVAKSDRPMVIFATPGMLHGGLSLSIFKDIATDSRNCVIIPGYCTAGTVGNKILSGERFVEIDKQIIEVKCDVYYMSFSAHADAKGLLQLIKNASPKNVVLVHGDVEVMKKFKKSVHGALGINTTMPANLEEIYFNIYQLYHQIEMNIHLFQNLYFLLEKNFQKNFSNSLNNFPPVKLKIEYSDNGQDKHFGGENKFSMSNFSQSKYLVKNKTLLLKYDNPLLKFFKMSQNNKSQDKDTSKNQVTFANIKNKIDIKLSNKIQNVNFIEVYEEFLKKYFSKIWYLYNEFVIKEKFVNLNLVKNDKLQISWSYNFNDINVIRKNKYALLVTKNLENFVNVLNSEN
jgi:integrator complex subunit 11